MRESHLAGRTSELATLRAALDVTLAGRPRVVLLAGEPGIGKTRLAEQLAEEAEQRGALVLWGRCWEGEGAPPYLPFRESLGQLVRGLEPQVLRHALGPAAPAAAQLLPEVGTLLPDLPATPLSESDEARYRLFDGLSRLLSEAAAARPLVLVLDDLHWADKPSLLLLQFLTRRLTEQPMLILGAYRDTDLDRGQPLAELLVALRRERGVERLDLHGLAEAEVAALIASLLNQELGARGHALASALARDTEGNPFFVREIVHHLQEAGALVQRDGRWTSDATSVEALDLPESVRQVVGRRLSRLSAGCNQVLSVAALIGRDFDAQTLAQTADVEVQELEHALAEAEAARLIEPAARGGRFRFAHALIQQTLVLELTSRQRARLHRRIGEALETRHARNPEPYLSELAYHLLEGTAAGGDVTHALDRTRGAARRAMAQFAYEQAARLYQTALQVMDDEGLEEPELRCDLLIAFGEALLPAAEPGKVVEVVAPAALALAERLGDRRRGARACLLALGGLGRFGANSAGLMPPWRMLAERAAALAEPDSIESVRAALPLGTLSYLQGDWPGVERHLRPALQTARTLGDPETLFQVGASLVDCQGPLQRQAERLQLAEEFLALPREGASTASLAKLLYRAASVLLVWSERARAEATWVELDELWRRTRDPMVEIFQLRIATVRAILDGRLQEACDARQALIARGDELGMPDRARQFAWSEGDEALHYLGRYEEVARMQREALERIYGTAAPDMGTPKLARALAYLGERAAATRMLHMLLQEAPVRFDVQRTSGPFALVGALDAAVVAGDRELAARLLPGHAEHAALLVEPFVVAPVGRIAGAALALLGDRPAARAAFEQALAAAKRLRYRPEIATIQLHLAELFAGGAASERVEARRLLETALPELEAMGMQPGLVRARALHARLGGRPTPPAFPAGLSEREVEVLRLVAAGQSNREIATRLVLSVHTVERHLVNMYAKIGVRGRADAVAYALRHGLAAPGDIGA